MAGVVYDLVTAPAAVGRYNARLRRETAQVVLVPQLLREHAALTLVGRF